MITPPFISACLSMMESSAWKPRRVGGPTRHGGVPIRRGALVLLPFGVIRTLGGGATSRWRFNTTWRGPNATWCARFTLFLGVLDPLSWSHVALEVQRDMARFLGSLLGCFAAFELEPRRVGSPTRHGDGPIRRGAIFWLSFGLFCRLWDGATSRWRSNATWRKPNTTWPSSNAAWWVPT